MTVSQLGILELKDTQCIDWIVLVLVVEYYHRPVKIFHIDVGTKTECIQSLCFQIYIKKQKWMLVSLYHLPKQHTADLDMFSCSVSKMVDRISAETYMIIIMITDFNIDLLKCEARSRMLCDLMSVNSMINIVKGPTCFKGDPPSMIDLCLDTKPRHFGMLLNYNYGLSDCHMVAVCTTITIANRKPTEVIYRSYKIFDEVKFQKDIEMIPFHVTEIFDDNDDRYWAYTYLLSNGVNTHAPIKNE